MNKNVVMGTAGHIDHGKTTLVKKLTGIDTDRLMEEKRRGMTIELGFAPLKLPSGNVLSIVDVPGHEKFVKTMVAGVTGIDFVMLVIAADEGVMAQTKEHINILSLLNVTSGIIVLTKVELVDEEWISLVEEDVKTAIKDTILENFQVIKVSAITGEGIETLLEKLDDLYINASKKRPEPFFRMPIDRVFTIQGHGTVITGTSLGGIISKGEEIKILPSDLIGKVRGIQVHNEDSEIARAGQRAALNISGIEKSQIGRGDIVTNEAFITPITLVDAILFTIKGNFNVTNNQRIHVNIGTKEALARITILGVEKINANEKAYVQLRFEEPIVALRGDRFIIRAFSPVVTLGGGIILSHKSKKRGRFKTETIETLETLYKGNIEDIINLTLKNCTVPLSIDELWQIVLGEKDEVIKAVKINSHNKNLIVLEGTKKVVSKRLYNNILFKINDEFNSLYKNYPFRFELSKDELKSKLFNNIDLKDFSDIIDSFVKDNIFTIKNNKLVKNEDKAFKKIMEVKETKLLKTYVFQYGLNLKTKEQIKKELIEKDKLFLVHYDDIEQFLIKAGEIVAFDNGLIIHIDILKQFVQKIRELFITEKFLATSYLKDYFNCSRKIIISILEYLDMIGVTERKNDLRQPGVHFMDFLI